MHLPAMWQTCLLKQKGIAANPTFLKAVVMSSLWKVPSAYCIADGILHADALLDYKLLLQPGGNTATNDEKMEMAFEDGSTLKKLTGLVRLLSREKVLAAPTTL